MTNAHEPSSRGAYLLTAALILSHVTSCSAPSAMTQRQRSMDNTQICQPSTQNYVQPEGISHDASLIVSMGLWQCRTWKAAIGSLSSCYCCASLLLGAGAHTAGTCGGKDLACKCFAGVLWGHRRLSLSLINAKGCVALPNPCIALVQAHAGSICCPGTHVHPAWRSATDTSCLPPLDCPRCASCPELTRRSC